MVANQDDRQAAPVAGTRALRLLADPLDARILIAPGGEPKNLRQLRAALGAPSPTTLRTHIRALEELGLLSRRRADRFPGETGVTLLEPGKRLLEVAWWVQEWLDACPSASVTLGSPTSHAVLSGLADGWSSLMLRALAATPLSLVQLDRLLAPFDYPTLTRRMDALRVAGLVRACSSRGRGIPYAPTAWLSRVVVPVIAAARWELVAGPASNAIVRVADVETALLLGATRIRAAANASGHCRFVVRIGEARMAGAVLSFDRGRVVGVDTNLRRFAGATVSGSVTTWMDAVLKGEGEGLALYGNLTLARSVVAGVISHTRR